MAEQTVRTRLELDSRDFQRELKASGKVAGDLAGDVSDMGAKIDRALAGVVESAGDVEQAIRGVDGRVEALTGADRELFLQANVGPAEAAIRQIDQMLADPKLTDAEIRLALDKRGEAVQALERIKSELDELGPAAAEVGEEIERGLNLGAIGGAFASGMAAERIGDAVTSAGRLQAQLGLTADEAEAFDRIAKRVYRDNFGENLGHARQVVGQVHQALGLVGDDLNDAAVGVFSIVDAFEHLGADTDITLNAVRTLSANFPGMSEAEVLDLVAGGFQTGAGRAGDLLDVLNEYPGDFSRVGLSARDMVGIVNEGLDAGVWNADRVGDAVREMGIRITTAGDLGQIAVRKMFPPDEAERIIRDYGRGGEAGREAFFTIMDALTQIEDPAERYNRSVELMGSLGEELANQFPTIRDGLLELRDGTTEAGTGVDGLASQYDGFRNTLDGLVRSLETSVLGTVGDVGLEFADVASNVGIAVLGFQGLRDVIPPIPGGLRGIAGGLGRIAAGAAAYGAAAWGVSELGDAIADLAGWSGMDLSNLAAELELLARTGDTGGVNVDRIALAIDEIIDPSFWESAGGTVSRGIDTIGQVMTLGMLDLRGTAVQYDRELGAVDAALAAMVESGNVDQAAAVFEQIAGAVEAAGHDAGVAAEAFPGYTTAVELAAARTEDMPDAADAAAEGVEAFGGAAGEAVDPVAQLEDAISGVNDALRAQFDPWFAATDALLANEEAQRRVQEAHWDVTRSTDELSEAVRKHGEDSHEARTAAWELEEAERNLDAANRDAARSALDVSTAMTELRARVEDGSVSLEDGAATLDGWVQSGLITEQQAQQLKDEMWLATEAARTLGSADPTVEIRSTGFREVLAQLDELARRAGTPLIFNASIAARERLERRTGGPIPGAFNEPVPVLAHGGEYVINAEAANALGADTLAQLNRGHLPQTTYTAPQAFDYGRLSSAIGDRQAVYNLNVPEAVAQRMDERSLRSHLAALQSGAGAR